MSIKEPMRPQEPATVRKNPCASCPYRRDVPSGVWAEAEYDMLPDFDGDGTQQVFSKHGMGVFHCHQADDKLCAGWAGHRDPHDLMALKIGVVKGVIDQSALDYHTDVPLFASGAEAAEHGKRDILAPDAAAISAALKIITVREARGEPVELVGPEKKD